MIGGMYSLLTFEKNIFSTSLTIAGNSGRLTWEWDSSHKSSTTHSYQCV